MIPISKDRNKPFELQLERVHRVSGIVLDESGQSVPGAILNVYHNNKIGISDTLGKFDIGIIFDLQCEYLFVRHIERNLAAIVDIKENSESIKVELKPALSIFGQITNVNGEGITAARVLLCAKKGNILLEVLTDPTGRYEMTAVPPEQKEFIYLISVEASGYGPIDKEPVSIKGEPGIPVKMKTISLQLVDRSISGVVVNTRGEPVAGVPIVLSGKGQPRRSTMSDDNGRFIINRICKGQCRLEAQFELGQSGKVVVQVEAGDQNVKIVSKR